MDNIVPAQKPPAAGAVLNEKVLKCPRRPCVDVRASVHGGAVVEYGTAFGAYLCVNEYNLVHSFPFIL
jgi:hypothetical protein